MSLVRWYSLTALLVKYYLRFLLRHHLWQTFQDFPGIDTKLISISYPSGRRERNKHVTLFRSMRDKTWVLFQTLCDKKLNSLCWKLFCCHVGGPCFEVNTTERRKEKIKEQALATPHEPVDQDLTQARGEFSVTWNAKHPKWEDIYSFDFIELFFVCLNICFQNSLCRDSTNYITRHSPGHFSRPVQADVIRVELPHRSVGLEWEGVMIVENVKSPCGARHLRLVFVMRVVHSKTLTKFNLWIKL